MTVTPDSLIAAGHLTLTQEDEDEYIVGDPGAGVFFSVPEIGARLIRLFADGLTVAEAAAVLEQETGADVDALDFAADLIAAGVVPAVDGEVTRERRERRSWLVSRIPARYVRPFFGRVAWSTYGLALAASIAVFVAEPGLVPTYEDAFFSQDILLSLIMGNVVTIGLSFVHEIWHAFAGASFGIQSRFKVNMRAYFPVFETDLTGIWTVPPSRRYGPFLAGMAVDGVLLFAALVPRFAWSRGWIEVSPTLVRVLGLVVLAQALKLAFQTLAFMRTDLYLVLLTATGTRNLHQVTMLSLKRLVWRLTPEEDAILAGAHPRDLRAVRWYRLLFVAGLLWLTWFAFYYLWPSAQVIVGWGWNTLFGGPIGRGWWEALLIAVLAFIDLAFPVVIYLRNRREKR